MNLKKLTFILLFISLGIFAQESKLEINDSLIRIIETKKGTEKLKAILEFCEQNDRSFAKQKLEYSSEGIILADELKNIRTKAELLRYQGASAFILGDMENSKSTLEKAIVLSKLINDSTNLGDCYRDLGSYYFTLGDYNKARIQDNLSLEIAKKINDIEMQLKASGNIAASYLSQGMYSKALKLLDEILIFCQTNRLDYTSHLLNKAIAIHNIGKPSEALGYFFEVRMVFVEREDFSSAALVEHHIGYLLKQTELYGESLQYYDSVKEFYEKSGNVNRLSAIHLSMGELMLKLNRLNEAENYLQKAIDFKKKRGIKTIGDAVIDLGLVALKREDYDLAVKFFEQAQEVYEVTEDSAGIAVVNNRFSMLYLGMENFKNAEEYAMQSLSQNKESGIKRELALSYENLVGAYEGQNKFDLALEAKKELEVVNADLNNSIEILALTKKLVVETLRINREGGVLDPSNDDEVVSENSFVDFWLVPILSVLLFGCGFYYVKLRNKPLTKNEAKVVYLQTEEANELLKALNDTIENEKPYLKQELTLSGLADLIHTSDKKLSALLNHSLSTSFYDYINSYRIKAVKEKLELEDFQKYSLVGLAYSCGFNSKSSFYRAFKKETGISPTVYKAQKVS